MINPNTKVVSVVRSGKYYYVTLTDDFLEPISGLPEGWQENETWAKLVQTSQQLAAYSVIDTLLSLGRASQVQILIASDVNSKGERPARSAMGFSADLADTRLMEPMTLDLSRVLTPQTTCNIILKAFSDKNWSRVEKFIAQSDPYATSVRPSQTDLVTQLQQLDLTLLDYSQKDVNISANGQSAVVTVSLTLQRTDATKATFTLLPFTFVWENNSWQLCYESLAQLFGANAP